MLSLHPAAAFREASTETKDQSALFVPVWDGLKKVGKFLDL